MIEADEVETLIVKDMSRLGREYLQVGQLMDAISTWLKSTTSTPPAVAISTGNR